MGGILFIIVVFIMIKVLFGGGGKSNSNANFNTGTNQGSQGGRGDRGSQGGRSNQSPFVSHTGQTGQTGQEIKWDDGPSPRVATGNNNVKPVVNPGNGSTARDLEMEEMLKRNRSRSSNDQIKYR